MKIILMGLLFSSATFGASCKDVKSCIELTAKLTGDQYLMDKDVKGVLDHSKAFDINKDNANFYLSYILNLAGYTRVKLNDNTWSVINARDIRYQAVTKLTYGKDPIPNDYDHYMVSIKLKNPYLTSEVTRNFRPFMSRYGRIIDLKDPGMIIINDTGKNIQRLVSLINEMDKELTPMERKKYERKQREQLALKQLEAQSCAEPPRKK